MSSFQIALYVIKCLIRAWNIKYNSIHCAANLLAGVVQYHVSSAWPLKVLRTVPTFVTVHTSHSAHLDTQVSYGWCLLIQGYFCTV